MDCARQIGNMDDHESDDSSRCSERDRSRSLRHRDRHLRRDGERCVVSRNTTDQHLHATTAAGGVPVGLETRCSTALPTGRDSRRTWRHIRPRTD